MSSVVSQLPEPVAAWVTVTRAQTGKALSAPPLSVLPAQSVPLPLPPNVLNNLVVEVQVDPSTTALLVVPALGTPGVQVPWPSLGAPRLWAGTVDGAVYSVRAQNSPGG